MIMIKIFFFFILPPLVIFILINNFLDKKNPSGKREILVNGTTIQENSYSAMWLTMITFIVLFLSIDKIKSIISSLSSYAYIFDPISITIFCIIIILLSAIFYLLKRLKKQ